MPDTSLHRGAPIPGSSLRRNYCAQCGQPIRVLSDLADADDVMCLRCDPVPDDEDVDPDTLHIGCDADHRGIPPWRPPSKWTPGYSRAVDAGLDDPRPPAKEKPVTDWRKLFRPKEFKRRMALLAASAL